MAKRMEQLRGMMMGGMNISELDDAACDDIMKMVDTWDHEKESLAEELNEETAVVVRNFGFSPLLLLTVFVKSACREVVNNLDPHRTTCSPPPRYQQLDFIGGV